MENLPLILILGYALYGGITHAFEADHVLAVSNLVSQRDRVWVAIKDGIFWGLGHTSTIFLVGVFMILFKLNISEGAFSYFEAVVGLMLILVASYRLIKFVREERVFIHKHKHEHDGTNKNLHIHIQKKGQEDSHKAAYGIGFMHGLAGSGALIVLVMAQLKSTTSSLLYLLTFGLGSVLGMVLIAGVFSIPFSKKLINSRTFRVSLIIISSVLCFSYGCYVIYENMII